VGVVIGGGSWQDSQATYRQLLFGTGCGPRERGVQITPERFAQVIAAKGRLPLADVLRCRVRYFADGAVLGSREFVSQHLLRYRAQTGRRLERPVHDLPPVTDWGPMTALRVLRRNAFG
jgi:hypothetical protein